MFLVSYTQQTMEELSVLLSSNIPSTILLTVCRLWSASFWKYNWIICLQNWNHQYRVYLFLRAVVRMITIQDFNQIKSTIINTWEQKVKTCHLLYVTKLFCYRQAVVSPQEVIPTCLWARDTKGILTIYHFLNVQNNQTFIFLAKCCDNTQVKEATHFYPV